jgi:hypothetical protein
MRLLVSGDDAWGIHQFKRNSLQFYFHNPPSSIIYLNRNIIPLYCYTWILHWVYNRVETNQNQESLLSFPWSYPFRFYKLAFQTFSIIIAIVNLGSTSSWRNVKRSCTSNLNFYFFPVSFLFVFMPPVKKSAYKRIPVPSIYLQVGFFLCRLNRLK